MIEKFIKIFRVGKFEDYSAAGNMQLRKINLIFGANGRGKTTLCAILRSLHSGNGGPITERASLNRTGEPEVHILLEGGKVAKFKRSAWDCNPAKLEIFDTNFVYENVYIGNDVTHDQKKAIYRVIVGEKGVALSRKVDKLAEDIKYAHNLMAEARAKVQAKIKGTDTVEKFVGLKKATNVDDLISEQEKTIAAYKSAAEIAAKGTLPQVDLPEIPSLDLLGKTIEDVSTSAEKLVADLATRLGDGAEAWIEQGYEYLDDSDVCPFCAQPIAGVDLVQAFKAHFNEEYARLKEQIVELGKHIDGTFGPTALAAIQKTVSASDLLVEFWSRFVALKLPELPFADIESHCKSLHERLKEHVEQKSGKPLESVAVEQDLRSAIAEFEKLRTRAAEYNAAVTVANNRISAKKAETKAGNVATEQAKLDTLLNTRERHEAATDALCDEFKTKAAAKEALEKQKQQAKDDLDLYSNSIFPTYQQEMNKLLQQFGAEFQITEPTRSFSGGKASSSYEIIINAQSIPLAAKNAGEHCLGNTLSGGDRAALALAFFLVKLAHDPNIADKCVVFDDPACSLDSFRMGCTIEQVQKVISEAKQVIVLCHDPYFLKKVYDRCDRSSVRTLFLDRKASETVIAEWDINRETQSQYFQDYFTLATFLVAGPSGKDLRDLVRKIRPIMEENLRFRFPDQFSTGWLGDFIGAISKAQPGSPLEPLKKFLREIEAINNFSKQYHHGTGTNPDTHPINEPEVQAYVRRTLEFLRGAA